MRDKMKDDFEQYTLKEFPETMESLGDNIYFSKMAKI